LIINFLSHFFFYKKPFILILKINFFNMKKIIILLTLSICASCAFAQINKPSEVVKRKSTDRVNDRVDRTIDKGLDKVEEGVTKIFKKKDKKKDGKNDDSNNPNTGSEDVNATQNGGDNSKNSPTTTSKNQTNNSSNANGSGDSTASVNAKLKTYSKFDFVAGEKVTAFETFERVNVGDFPTDWNTNAGGEVVTVEGQTGKWLQLGKRGIFAPEFIKTLPDNFTLEYDMMASEDYSEMMGGLQVAFVPMTDRMKFNHQFNGESVARFDVHPYGAAGKAHHWHQVVDKNDNKTENELDGAWLVGKPNKVSIWRQNNRIRLYVNDLKVWDLPRAFDQNLSYQLLFAANTFKGTLFLTNIRLAEGAPDTRSKLITEGRFTTTGILFDVNSDRIRGDSYGTLKDIAAVLKDNPSVKVNIIGHTDADGADAANLDLSKRRAASVKTALATEFGIAADRMQTDGKGEAQPVASNNTPEGKANNRRVEFVKL
jgi:OmpA-OmpF porin, OOP family